MKVGLLQFAPKIGQVETNMAKADEILSKSNVLPGAMDILILPELAFTGYVFRDKNHIAPFIETTQGPTFEWAQRVARRLHCHVQVGLARLAEVENGDAEWRNSVILVDPSGELVHVYDKHFLYEVDERWAAEGDSFKAVSIMGRKLGFAICMDINPYRFESPFEEFEFAHFHKEAETDFVSASMAWVLSPGDSARKASTPLSGTLNYWATRMMPMIDSTVNSSKRIIMAVCNRVGGENGTDFCGSSCVLEFANGGASLLGAMGYKQEGFIVVDTLHQERG
ncbi:Carbon-nitrogen hydrolase [Chytriomyces hyalinus]|nr:Carbon-nitrogen hydrolase [Chytriomyces hyalinus]